VHCEPLVVFSFASKKRTSNVLCGHPRYLFFTSIVVCEKTISLVYLLYFSCDDVVCCATIHDSSLSTFLCLCVNHEIDRSPRRRFRILKLIQENNVEFSNWSLAYAWKLWKMAIGSPGPVSRHRSTGPHAGKWALRPSTRLISGRPS